MAEGEIKSIRAWETVNELTNHLSTRYHDALNLFITRRFVKVKSETSYGNPREYELIESVSSQINSISKNASKKLQEVLLEYIKMPF